MNYYFFEIFFLFFNFSFFFLSLLPLLTPPPSVSLNFFLLQCVPPFNYPVNLAVSKLAPALVAGNAIVLKPPTQGAVAALHMVQCFAQAGFPKGLINAVTGKGSEIGDYMTTHPKVRGKEEEGVFFFENFELFFLFGFFSSTFFSLTSLSLSSFFFLLPTPLSLSPTP